MKQENKLFGIYKNLFDFYGPQKWWPTISRGKKQQKFEICVGAILTQNTNWQNVEKAIFCLHKNKLLDPLKIIGSRKQVLGSRIKPSGYYRVKAEKLKVFSRMLFDDFSGDVERLLNLPIKQARDKLLSTWGIGPETADSMLLYAGNKPIFVIDAYTKRLAKCLGVKNLDYHDLQAHFMNNLPKSVKLYNEFHALIVALGKNYCKTKPLCKKCLVKN